MTICMTLTDGIVFAVIALIISLAIVYIVHAKKSGQKCVGCPHSKTCHASSDKSGNCCCEENK